MLADEACFALLVSFRSDQKQLGSGSVISAEAAIFLNAA
jgi:hypothetical protein